MQQIHMKQNINCYLLNKREDVGLKRYNDPKDFIEYSGDIQDVYKILKSNPGKN